ncbi:MAG: hypothetical protein HZC51_14315 [Nitrospirae bacterium]|nr:hypothetical protein [Nitrospirota bacterium]
MEQTICGRVASVKFWDGYAKWYKQWMDHTRYHESILDALMMTASPGWKVLDIGAGSGVLSLPLCAIGCDVTALEPSTGMRNLLFAETFKRGIDWLNVDDRTWEGVEHEHYEGVDLVVACNSLHLSPLGFKGALDKVFALRPANIFVVTELGPPEIKVTMKREGYTWVFVSECEADSSFAYHCFDEAFMHWSYNKGRALLADEMVYLESQLKKERGGGHYWVKDKAVVGMYWFRRIDERFETKEERCERF